MVKYDILGEGRYATCRLGFDINNATDVAVKMYKAHANESDSVALKSFMWQVKVLQILHTGSEVFSMHQELSAKQPSDLFVMMIDFSRDAEGQPGIDASKGLAAVILELAQYTLSDYLAANADSGN